MTAYYNEHDAQKAAWLRELIRRNLIASGEVDERSIEIIQPDELRGFTQCHFFAGIGVWSYALRNAGWSDSSPVWTGSCPCPSFSTSGQGLGFSDPRHLWPAWFRLLRVLRPNVVFGEQVASDAALSWLDLVSSDLEGEDYAIGAADLCAAGVGAPHIRQRLYFVADTQRGSAERHGFNVGSAAGVSEGEAQERQRLRDDPRNGGEFSNLAHPESERRGEAGREHSGRSAQRAGDASQSRELGDTDGLRPQGRTAERLGAEGRKAAERSARLSSGHGIVEHSAGIRHPQRPGEAGTSPKGEASRPEEQRSGADGFWRDIEWLPCRDGKARPVEPGTFPLAHGAPARVVRLRGYGDAIVAPLAQAFIEAYSEVRVA